MQFLHEYIQIAQGIPVEISMIVFTVLPHSQFLDPAAVSAEQIKLKTSRHCLLELAEKQRVFKQDN
jgi:hypothetical protein